MTGRDEAARLREHRLAFELAIERNIPLKQANFELAKLRWQAADAALARKRCGTALPPVPTATAYQGDRELQWWQR